MLPTGPRSKASSGHNVNEGDNLGVCVVLEMADDQ